MLGHAGPQAFQIGLGVAILWDNGRELAGIALDAAPQLAVYAPVPFSISPRAAALPCLRPGAWINSLLSLGSHNSYRPELDGAGLIQQRQRLGDHAAGVEYGHPAIARQLDLGVRQVEFNPYADTLGGRFAALHAQDPARLSIMNRPVAKVLHAPLVDACRLCLTLEDCFSQVNVWSRAHPDHALMVIFVNTKDDGFKNPAIPDPEPYTETSLAVIDASALAVFGRDRIVTPDTVRGSAATLREAVLNGDWPSQTSARGKVLLVLDSNPRVSELYCLGHPSLRGRVMFGLYDAARPEAAIFSIQNPLAEEARIKALVAQGFSVRTRSDADTREARAHDLSRLAAAERSGAQIISADYYPGAPDPLGLKFVVRPAFFDTAH